MKNKYFKYYVFMILLASLFLLLGCKTKEYVSVYYLDRDDNVVLEEKVEKGSKLVEKELLEKEEGSYYVVDYEEAKADYDLNKVEDVVWLYLDLVYSNVEYKVYYNNELVKEKSLAFNKTFNDFPDLPENAVKKNQEEVWDKSDIKNYKCDIKVTYEIVEPTYEIKFFDGKNEVLDVMSYKRGDNTTLPTYEKEGYEFLGWFLDDLSYSKYEKIDCNMKGNINLYARFEETVIHERLVLPESSYKFTGVRRVETSISGVYTTQPVLPTGAPAGATNYNWESSNTSVATISKYSSMTANSAGYTIITATLISNPSVKVNGVFKVTSDGISFSNEEDANTLTIHTVTFVGKDNEVIETVKVKDTGTVSYPCPKNYDGFVFTGWDKQNYNITEDTTIKATYTSSGSYKNEYAGKRFSIIGDSISTYKGIIPSSFSCFYPYPTADVNDYNLTWWMKTINKLGGSLFFNNSYSGSCVADDSSSATHKPSRLNYMFLQGQYADVCMILMGANDAASSSIRDNAFKTRYIEMVEYLKDKAPNMEIILLTLPISKLYSDARRESFNTIIKEIAETYNLKLVDLGSLDIRNDLVDSAHPKTSGMQLISDEIIRWLTTNE